ncbi:MAG TPA: hypothetical protein VF339_16360 [Gammaproteobacteria bacterium]
MTAKVIRIPEFREREADPSAEPAKADKTAAGWDPYEVWRTRVLLPRLDEPRSDDAPNGRPGKRSIFDRLRRLKAD